ncbi:MAG: hypothetical protein IPI21_18770 [Propionivibrio sp.]|nr:hypothetical protein [Propionivibrio sp.]
MRRYAASELSSRDYVKTSLELLAAHKNRLKVNDQHGLLLQTPNAV